MSRENSLTFPAFHKVITSVVEKIIKKNLKISPLHRKVFTSLNNKRKVSGYLMNYLVKNCSTSWKLFNGQLMESWRTESCLLLLMLNEKWKLPFSRALKMCHGVSRQKKPSVTLCHIGTFEMRHVTKIQKSIIFFLEIFLWTHVTLCMSMWHISDTLVKTPIFISWRREKIP